MLVQCPFCYNDVLPRGDDSCPNCDELTTDEKALMLPLRPYPFPCKFNVSAPCASCGTTEADGYRHTEKFVDQDAAARNIVDFFVGSFAGSLLGLSGGRSEKVSHEVSFVIPLCKDCTARKNIEIHQTEFDRGICHVMCHRKFRETLSEQSDELIEKASP